MLELPEGLKTAVGLHNPTERDISLSRGRYFSAQGLFDSEVYHVVPGAVVQVLLEAEPYSFCQPICLAIPATYFLE
jgi:hypothetical protein